MSEPMERMEYVTVSDIQVGDEVIAEFREEMMTPIRGAMYQRCGGTALKYHCMPNNNGRGTLKGKVINGIVEMIEGRMFHYLVEFPTGERLWFDPPDLQKVVDSNE